MKKFFLIFITSLFTQTFSQFNIDQYKQFLNSNLNMSTEQLLQMHPAGIFEDNINIASENALYFDSIAIKLNLTNYEKSLIQKHGFMVSERLSYPSFGQPLLDIFQKDLPVFVSTDAILHAYHKSYDKILRDMELSILIKDLKELLNGMHQGILQLASIYPNPGMKEMLKDVDFYLTVPLILLDENVQLNYSENQPLLDRVLNLIEEEETDSITIFSNHCRDIDFSQFKPRGHYTLEAKPELAKYFKAMMWLGRVEIYLTLPNTGYITCFEFPTIEDVQRQSIDAMLISELIDLVNKRSVYNEMENIIRFFVGNSDNVTLENLEDLKGKINLQSAEALLDTNVYHLLVDSLKNQPYANQLILSQMLMGSNPMNPDSIIPPSAFLLFGQRFVIDSYVTASVVYDRIKYNNERPCRLFPSALDPMFALGNNAAAQLLKSELEAYHYSTNLASLRYLLDSYEESFWDSTLYNNWLRLIKSLNPPDNRNDLPSFMQTSAFWQQKLNTQLASWSQLRHDNLLYAKQSYTGGTLCSYPFSYVEPFPEFYFGLKKLAQIALDKFQQIDFDDPYQKFIIIDYFNGLKNISDTLGIIAQKELSNIPFSEDEITFLKTMLYSTTPDYSNGPLKGWYPRLFYNDFTNDELLMKDHIVADIHTTPTDCSGSLAGWITHVGTGDINLGVFIADLPGGEKVAFVGPNLGYYEFLTTNFLRLTDQEWDNEHLQSATRPSWVNLYLADSSGNSRGSGLMLVTDVEKSNHPIIPNDHLIINNYPNPFNPSTIINFTIPSSLTNSQVELNIYNINGELINRLVNEVLPSGNYLSKWNGANERGETVTSGVYLYKLLVKDKQVSGKMMLIK